MTEGIEVTPQTGPIRCSGRIRVRAILTPIAITVGGTPGPAGARGIRGDKGEQGEPGALDAGITIDGGNF